MKQVCGIFSRILNLFQRLESQRAVQDHKTERHMRGFTASGKRQELTIGGENALGSHGMGMRIEVGAAPHRSPPAWGGALPQKSTNRPPIRIEFAPSE